MEGFLSPPVYAHEFGKINLLRTTVGGQELMTNTYESGNGACVGYTYDEYDIMEW